MAQTVDYDIVGSYNNQRRTSIDGERSINLFEYLDPLAKKPKILIPTSGLQDSGVTFTGVTTGFRAQFVFAGYMFNVVGNTVYRLQQSANGQPITVTTIGTLNTSSGYVGIDANTYQVIFVDGVNGYIYDINSGLFVVITDTGFPPFPIDVTNLDNFFIVGNGGTNNFYLSSLNNGLVWSGGTAIPFTGAMATSLITVASAAGFQTGVPVTVAVGSGPGTLPTPLVAGVTYWVYNPTNSTSFKLATSYQNAITGVTITLTGDSSPVVNIFVSGEQQIGSITSHPGNIVAVQSLHRFLFLFSSNYTEVWQNAGLGSNLPFRRINDLLIEYGTPAVASVVAGFDRLFFLSQDKDGLGSVMEIIGNRAQPVSTRALDFQLSQYLTTPNVGIADAKGILIKENGLIFYRLNFTKANHTFVLGVTMSDQQNLRWHEEEVLNGNRHPAQTHAFYNGINYYGDYLLPIMYVVDASFNSNNGDPIRRARIPKPFVPEGYQRIRVDRFQLDLIQGDISDENLQDIPQQLLTESGFSLQTEDGRDIFVEQDLLVANDVVPVVFLSISKDGGQTYGFSIRAPMGSLGDRTFRTVWRKLGTTKRGQAFQPMIEFFNVYPFTVLGASWAMEVLPE